MDKSHKAFWVAYRNVLGEGAGCRDEHFVHERKLFLCTKAEIEAKVDALNASLKNDRITYLKSVLVDKKKQTAMWKKKIESAMSVDSATREDLGISIDSFERYLKSSLEGEKKVEKEIETLEYSGISRYDTFWDADRLDYHEIDGEYMFTEYNFQIDEDGVLHEVDSAEFTTPGS